MDLYGLTTISGCGPPNIYAPVVGISLAIHKYTLNCNDPEVRSSLIPNMTLLDTFLQIVEIVYDSTVINATIVYDCPGCGDSGIGEWRDLNTSAHFHSLDFPWQ